MKISADEFKKISKKNIKNFEHKYKAKRIEIDGIKFDSKKEAHFYETLKELKNKGDVRYFLRQVPLHLPGNVKYVVDFLVFWENGKIQYIDVKGFDTPLSKTKRKMVENIYPIEIHIW